MSRESKSITNQGEIVGKIHNIDSKFLENGKGVCTVTLEIVESWGEGADQRRTSYPAIGFYGKPAEAAMEFNKGDVVRIVYSLRSSPKKDNPAQHWTNIGGFVIQLSSGGSAPAKAEEPGSDDMPF